MHRSVIGVCFAGAIGLAATLGAQSPTTTSQPSTAKNDHEVTISGCLAKGATGYMLNNARVEPNASASTTTAPGATTTTASSPTPTTTAGGATTTAGTTGTTGAAAAAAAAAASPAMTWMLSGDSDLEKHVGHKIQVTGKTTWSGSPSSTTPTGTTSTTTSGASAEQPRLDVKSIKMVSTSCS